MTAIPSELLECYRSLFFNDGKYSAQDVCRKLLEHRDEVKPEWIDFFFADCMFPLEISYDVWRNADDRRRLRELLELEETLLGSVSEEQLGGKEAIENYIYYYNHKRIKRKLAGMSPVQYRIHTSQWAA